MATGPRIFVACLASSNAGKLHGAWIDATQDVWGMWAEVAAMLARSPAPDAEEYAIHDYEGFESIRLARFEGLEHVANLAAFVVERGALGAAVYRECDHDLDEARHALSDRYLGCYESVADFMAEAIKQHVAVPQALGCYIDWDAMARDAEINGEVFAVRTACDAVHVFSAW